MRLALALLALAFVTPTALAESFHDYEALHEGQERSFPLTITARDVGVPHWAGLRGFDSRFFAPFAFLLEACTTDGHEVWWVNRTRGIVELPEVAASVDRSGAPACGSFAPALERNGTLAPGSYTLWVHGHGAFQLTDKRLALGGNSSTFTGTVRPPGDAWLFAPGVRALVTITGNVSGEQHDFARDVRSFAAPATMLAQPDVQYVFSINGTTGGAYTISLALAPEPTPMKTPGVGLAGVLALALALALALKRRT